MRDITIIIMILTAFIGGCMEWYNPNKDASEFGQDKYTCLQQAAQMYPVDLQQKTYGTGYQSPSTTDCNTYQYGNSGTINCTTTPGKYTPPATITVDVNSSYRNAAFKACMNANGWTLRLKGTTSEDTTSSIDNVPITEEDIASKKYSDKDFAGAFAIYKKLAEAGNASAEMQVGNMYFSGQGVQRDYVQALYWYKKLAEDGNATAQKNVGIMYELGLGVESNKSEAELWYKRANQQK